MRNYQYTPEEEAQMDAFANEWKKTSRGIKGPSAWRQFKLKHPWAKRITADALRQKYTRLKRDQYWRAFAVTHQNCPRGHATCLANPPYQQNFNGLLNDINNYVSFSTETILPNAPLPATFPTATSAAPATLAPTTPAPTAPEATPTSDTPVASVVPAANASTSASHPEDVVTNEIAVVIPSSASSEIESKPAGDAPKKDSEAKPEEKKDSDAKFEEKKGSDAKLEEKKDSDAKPEEKNPDDDQKRA